MMHNKPLVVTWLCYAIFALNAFLLFVPTHAADRFWIDTSGGPFELSSNWSLTSGGVSGASVPTVGDNAVFDQSGNYTVTFADPGPAESDDLRITLGDVTFQRTTGAGSGIYNVGADAEITGGNLTLGIPGNLATLNVADDLVVRHSASGSNSLLSILFGSDVTVTDDVGIGASSAATGDGTVTISGSGSSLTAPSGLVNIGGFGNTGVLNVQSGASANLATSSDMVGIGNSSFGSTVGTLLVDSGSTVNTGNIGIATLTSLATGSITVDEASSVLEQTLPGATLSVGSSSGGAGLINVTNGGTFTTGTGSTTIGATGTLNINGGNFNARGGLDNSTGGTLNHHDGTLTVTGGTFQPNAGGPTDDYVINGSSDGVTPHVVIGIGASVGVGNRLLVGGVGGGIPSFGSNHNGALTITNGGDVTSVSAEIGSLVTPLMPGPGNVVDFGTGSVTVDGDSSTWTNAGNLSIKNGDLFIQNGAVVLNQTASLGYASQSAGLNAILFQTLGNALITGRSGTGTPSTWTNTGALRIGHGGFGELTIEEGAVVTSSAGFLGALLGTTLSNGKGTATVDGLGSQWVMTDNLTINFAIAAPGPGSELTITNGGLVSSAGGTIGNGTVIVDGTNAVSTWTNSSILSVGTGGNSKLTVQNGGVVTNTDGTIGTGVVTVTGHNGGGNHSNWTNSGTLQVGTLGTVGNATLTIEGGGEVSNTSAMLAVQTNSIATVTISGAGSRWANSADLYVGGSDVATGGRASVLVEDQAVVEVAGTLKVWDDGDLIVDGGTLKFDSTSFVVDGSFVFVSGNLHLNNAAEYSIGAASGPLEMVLGGTASVLTSGQGLLVDQTLIIPSGASLYTINGTGVTSGDQIINDGLLFANNTPLESSTGLTNNADFVLIETMVEGPVTNGTGSTVTVLGTVDFNGMVSGSGNFFGPGTANFNGGLSIGASPAEVSFEGHVALSATNELTIELGGVLSGSEFDHLSINGDASLGGTLAVNLIDSFMPAVGDTFEIISATSVLDMFDVEDLPDIGGLTWDVQYNSASVVLSILTPFTADFDLDGDVDGNDLTDPVNGWQARYGTNLNGSNFLDWQRQFGSGVLSLAASSAVPEPSGAALLFCLTAAGFFRSRDRQVVVYAQTW